MNWYCQSCNKEIEQDNRVEHFVKSHYFRPLNTPVQEVDDNAGIFYFEKFDVNTECPYCRVPSVMLIEVTEKSVRMTCQREECSKIAFYRQVILERSN